MSTVIFNSDNLVQGTITTVTSTPLGINIYAYNTNLSSLSSYSYLNISGTNANLNSLSSYSYLNISGTNANLNSLSS